MYKFKQLVWKEPDSHPNPLAPDHNAIMKCRFKVGEILLVGLDSENLKTWVSLSCAARYVQMCI